MAQKKLFEELDYKKAKEALPQEFEPLEYISVPFEYKTVKYIHVGWYKSEKEVKDRLKTLHLIFPFIKFSIDKQLDTAISYKFGFFAPEIIQPYLSDDEIVTVCVKRNQYNVIPKFVYRQIGNHSINGDRYVKSALNEGSILISSFEKFRKLENERQDIYEQRNKINVFHSNGTRIEFDVAVELDCLVLCTSLPSFNDFENKNEWIKINDVDGFINGLTKTLINAGVEIYEVLFGSCVYNDKKLSINNDEMVDFVKEHPEKITNTDFMNYFHHQLQDDLIMNKPKDFAEEKEFRIVFKLLKKIDASTLRENVCITDRGIVITDKALTKYFEKVE